LVATDSLVTSRPLDFRPLVDPLCRCLEPNFDPSKSTSVLVDVKLRHRNVFPRYVTLKSEDGRVVWQGSLPRADSSRIGEWQRVVMQAEGTANVWNVAPVSEGGDGPLPPWHALHVYVERKSLEGAPSADDVPAIKNLVFIGGADSIEGAYVADLHVPTATGEASMETTRVQLTRHDGSMGETLPFRFYDLDVMIGRGVADQASAMSCAESTCGGAHVLVDVSFAPCQIDCLSTDPEIQVYPVSLALEYLVLHDAAGKVATVNGTADDVQAQRASEPGVSRTLWFPVAEGHVAAEAGFDWTQVRRASFSHVGFPPPNPVSARAAGFVNVSRLRVGVPQRVGHVTDPGAYALDDMACDPLLGWYDVSPFARHDTTRYAHCRECCCFFDDPANPGTKMCFDQGDIMAEVAPSEALAPNDQCAVCNRVHNGQVMSPRNFLPEFLSAGINATCDDGEACTHSDRCTDEGACVGDTYLSCFIKDFHGGDPSKDCEVCDGTGPDSPTHGCVAAPGKSVHNPTGVFAERTCGCVIDGESYGHLQPSPRSPCQVCDVTQSYSEWTFLPDDLACNITDQFDYENLPSQSCSFNYKCVAGECRGTGYSCPPLQTCEAPAPEYPNVCDMSGPASATGGCRRRLLEEGTVCAPEVHGCMPASECTGAAGTCPPQLVLPGIIYNDVGKAVELLLPDGTPADAQLPVLPSEEILVSVERYRVQCGDLNLRTAVLEPGDCTLHRVLPELGGWGDGFDPAPRGSFSLISRPVPLSVADNANASADLLVPVHAADAAARRPDHVVPSPDSHDLTDAVQSVFLTAGIVEPVVDVTLRRDHGAVQLTRLTLYDDLNRSAVFHLPQVFPVATWTLVSAKVDADNSHDEFRWGFVSRVELLHNGAADVSSNGTALTLQQVSIRTRAQAPPCPAVPLDNGNGNGNGNGNDAPAGVGLTAVLNATSEVTSHTGAVTVDFVAPLSPAADASSLYDATQNAWKDGAVLVMDVVPPVPGFAPTEVALRGSDGKLVVAVPVTHSVPAPTSGSVDGDAGEAAAEGVLVVARLLKGTLPVDIADDTLQAVTSIHVRFSSDMVAASEAAGVPVTVRVRNPRVVLASLCAHGLPSFVNSDKQLFAATSRAPALIMEPLSGVTTLRATVSASADTSTPSMNLDLAEFWDADCGCFADAVLEVEVDMVPSLLLTRVDILETSSGDGIQVQLAAPHVRASTRLSSTPAARSDSRWQRAVVSAPLRGAHVTLVGPPESWENVNVLRFHHQLRTDAPVASLSPVLVRSVRVAPRSVPCVTSTALPDTDFVPPTGAVITGRASTMLSVAGGGAGAGGSALVQAPDAESGSRVDAGPAFAPTRVVGAWMDRGGDGDSEYTAAATVLVGRTASAHVTLGWSSTAAPSVVADAVTAPVHDDGTPQAVLSVRNGLTGAGVWGTMLGNVTGGPAAVAAAGLARAVVVGQLNVAASAVGAPAHMAGLESRSATQGGGGDAFAMVLDLTEMAEGGEPTAGAGAGLGVHGTADGTDAWTCVAAHATMEAARTGVVVGGYSSGNVSAMFLSAPAAGALNGGAPASVAAQSAVVASFFDVDGLTSAFPTPVWLRELGHGMDHNTSARVTGVAAIGRADASGVVVVVGDYEAGRLALDATTELPACPAPPSPSSAPACGFAAGLAADTGATLWARAIGAAPTLSAAGDVAVVTEQATATQATVTALAASSGAVVWSTRVDGVSGAAVAVATHTVSAVGTVPAGSRVVVTSNSTLVGAAVDVACTFPSATSAESESESGSHAATSDGLVVVLDVATGRCLHGERLGGADANVTLRSAAATAIDGAAHLVLAGSVQGRATFGHPAEVAFAAPAPASVRHGASLLLRLPGTVQSSGAPVRVLRAGGGSSTHQVATGVVALPRVLVECGVQWPVVPAAAAAAAAANPEFVGQLRFVERVEGVEVASVPLDASWGVDGPSAWVAAAAAGSEQVIAVGHVASTVRGLLTVPGAAARVTSLAFPDTQEPVVAALDAAGRVLWAVSSKGTGATAGRDDAVGVAFDARHGVAVVVGDTDATGMYTCGHTYGAGGRLSSDAAGPGCTHARLALLDVGDGGDVSQPPVASRAWVLGGDGVSTTATGVSTRADGVFVVTGTVAVSATPFAPDYLDRALRLPTCLRDACTNFSSTWSTTPLSPPADGSTATWVATYSMASGRLLWATLGSGSATPEQQAGDEGEDEDLLSELSVAVTSATWTDAGVAVCGEHTGADSVSWSATPPSMVGIPASAVGGGADVQQMAASPLTPSHGVFVALLDAGTGAVSWMQWAAPAQESTVITCESIVALGDVVMAVGAVSTAGASSSSEEGDAEEQVAFGNADEEHGVLLVPSASAVWASRFGIGNGRSWSRVATTTTPFAHAGASSAAEPDFVGGATADAATSSVLVAGGAWGGPMQVLPVTGGASSPPTIGGVVGDIAIPDGPPSWDSTITAFPVAPAGVALPGHAAATMSTVVGAAVAAASPTLPADVHVGGAAQAPSSSAGMGFFTSVSVGAAHVVSGGMFKGTLQLGDTSIVGHGDVGVATHAYDGLVVAYPATQPTGLGAPTALRPTVDGVATADDRVRACASSPNGRWHAVVGHADVAAAGAGMSFAGASATMPGDGGRDGFVVLLSDATLEGQWLLPVGAVVSNDDALLAVSMSDSIVVAGGYTTGAVPSHGVTAVYPGTVSLRQLATVYTAAVGDGNAVWGKAFGTDTSYGSATTTAVAMSGDGAVIAMAGYFSRGSLMVGSYTLPPAIAAFEAEHTAFVALLDASDGSVTWAKAAAAAPLTTRGVFSVVRGVAVSASAVIAVGEFHAPSTGQLQFGTYSAAAADAVVGVAAPLSGAATNTTLLEALPHAFVGVFARSDGATSRVHVPQCPDGCRAGGVALSGSAALVSVVHQGTITFAHQGPSPVVVSPAGSHRGVNRALVAVYGNTGFGAERAVPLSSAIGNTAAFVDALGVAVGPRGSMAALAGWQTGFTGFLDHPSWQAGVALPTFDGVRGASGMTLLEFQPFVAVLDTQARAGVPVAPASTLSHRQGAAVSVLAAVRPSAGGATAVVDAVPSFSTSLGRRTAISAVTHVSSTLGVSGALPGGATLANPRSTTRGAVVLSDRATGRALWAWQVMGVDEEVSHSAVATAADPSGDTLCVAGSYTADAFGFMGPMFGNHSVDGQGGEDAFVACFPDVSTDGAPTWLSQFAAEETQRATALATSAGVVWAAFTTAGSIEYAGADLTHASPGSSHRCVLASMVTDSGSGLHSMVFGGEAAGDDCTITAVAASKDASRVYVAGTFRGSALQLPGRSLSPTHAGRTTPFLACFDSPGAARGPWQLRFASMATFDNTTYIPPGDVFATVDGITLSEAAAPVDGGATGADRVYLSGRFASRDIAWGDQWPTATCGTACVGSDAGVTSSTGYVAMFESRGGVDAIGAATLDSAVWVTPIRAVDSTAISAVAGVALAEGGVVATAVTTSSPIFTSATGHASASATTTPPVFNASHAANAGSFAVVVHLDALTGALVGGVRVRATEVGSVTLVTPPGLAARRAAAPSLALAGCARGTVVSSDMPFTGASVASPAGGDDVILFSSPLVSLRAVAEAPDAGIPVLNRDASLVRDFVSQHHMVQFEVQRSRGASGVVAGGTWQGSAGAGSGPGLAFDVTPAGLAAQAAAGRGDWVTVAARLAVSPALPRGTAGADGSWQAHFHGVAGGAAFGSLQALTLHADARNVDPDTRWRVRNVRVVPTESRCVPCGHVSVREPRVDLAMPRAVAVQLAAQRVPLVDVDAEVSSANVLPVPVDMSTLVHPGCNCLDGATLRWMQRVPVSPNATAAEAEAEAGVPVVTGVMVGNLDGSAGATSFDVTSSPPLPAADDDATHTWQEHAVTFTLGSHVNAGDMDWSSVQRLAFLTSVEGGSPAAPAGTVLPPSSATVSVRHVKLERGCPVSQSLLHPRPTAMNTSLQVGRGGLHLKQGESYRVLAVEVNMWGDVGSPTCSPVFIYDATPPMVVDADVHHVLPGVGGTDQYVDYSSEQIVKVGWSGEFVEAESAPDNILLFRIAAVTADAPDGEPEPGLVSEENLLSASGNGFVETQPLPGLQDGRAYYVHLEVCNRGKLCTSVASSQPLIHDSSPPESPAFVTVPNTTTMWGDAALTQRARAPSHHQTEDDQVHVMWIPFTDPHSWTTDVRVGMGTSGFGTDVHELQVVSNDTVSMSFAPKLGKARFTPGRAYYVVFSVTNHAGAQAFYRTAPLYVDQTPPVPHWAADVFPRDVAGMDTYYTVDANVGDIALTDGTAVRAKFKCDDPESVDGGAKGNMTYRWRVCSTAECDRVVYADWMDVGITPRGTASPSAMADARAAGTLEWVFVQVECTNPVGMTAVFSSDGALFDDTPINNSTAVVADTSPAFGTDQAPATGDIDWLGFNTVRASWMGFHAEDGRPPLQQYLFGVGTAPGLDDVQAFASVGLATEAATDPDVTPLEQGHTYYITVAAVSTAGAVSTAWSDGFTVDMEPRVLHVEDIMPDFLFLNETYRCMEHLNCMAVAEEGEDIDFIPSMDTMSFRVWSATPQLAPTATTEYGVSLCSGDPLALNVLPIAAAANASATRFDSLAETMLFHGQSYCAVVFQTNAAGIVSYNVSDGVTVDITPPVALTIHEGPSSQVDDDATPSLTNVTVTLECADTESGIHHAEVMVTAVDFATGDVLGVEAEWGVVPDSASPPGETTGVTHVVQGLNLTQGDWYVTTVRCVNGAGAYVDLDSDGFTADTTPPSMDGVTIRHAVHDVHVAAQPDADTISASWSGFSDDLSALESFSWSIGTAPHLGDVMNITDVGAATTVTASGLNLQDGVTYYITVYAHNDAGLVSSTASSGVTVDSSAPLSPERIRVVAADGSGEFADSWLGVTDSIHVSWTDAVDPHSDVTYRWAMGTAPHGQHVQPWSEVGANTSAVLHGLSLIPGMPYFVTVEATNVAGLTTVTLSNRIGVDPYPPSPGVVVNGRSLQTAVSAQLSADLSCAWSGFDDSLSGIQSYHVGMGTTPGASNVAPLQVLPPAAGATAFNVTGTPGTTYYCVVTAYDYAGNAATVVSGGSVVDVTPPVAGQVLDVSASAVANNDDVDVDYMLLPTKSKYRRTVAAVWVNWYDAESGVTRVEWSVGTSPEAADVLAWTHVDSYKTRAEARTAVTLQPETKYFTSVRMWNQVGLITTATSDGFTVLYDTAVRSEGGLHVETRTMHIPAYAVPGNASWCSCGDAHGALAASGAVFDPVHHVCSCGADTFLDAQPDGDLLCVPCPTGTCKRGLGNSMHMCSAAACAEPLPTTPMPVDASALEACGEEGLGKFWNNDTGLCSCPPGTRALPSGACIRCGDGTINAWHADVAQCRVCSSPIAPDTVLRVSWDASQLVAAGKPPTHFVVSTGTSVGALRWRQTHAFNASLAEFYSRAAGDAAPPFHHGSHTYVRVRALADGGETSLADTRVVAPVVDYTPPTGGGVTDGDPRGYVDMDVVTSGSSFKLAWHSFADGEWSTGKRDLGVHLFHVAVGSNGPGSVDVSGGWHVVRDASAATIDAVGVVPEGTRVHATVLGINGAGAWVQASSSGAVVQSEIPEGIIVVVPVAVAVAGQRGGDAGTFRHTTSQVATRSIAAAWHFPGADLADGVVLSYVWSVVDLDRPLRKGGYYPIVKPTKVGDAEVGYVTKLSKKRRLRMGHRYEARVTATNTAGLSRTIASPFMLVDATPATPQIAITSGRVVVAGELQQEVRFIASPSEVGVAWQCEDPEAGEAGFVFNVSVALGSTVGGDQALQRHTAEFASGSVTWKGLSLVHGHCYMAQLACQHAGAELVSEYVSSKPVCVDVTGPQLEVVVLHPTQGDATGTRPSPISARSMVLAQTTKGARVAVPLITSMAHSYASAPALELFLENYLPFLDVVPVSTAMYLPARVSVTAVDSQSGIASAELGWVVAANTSTVVLPPRAVEVDDLDVLGNGVYDAQFSVASITQALQARNLSTSTAVVPLWRVTNGAGAVSQVLAPVPLVADSTPPLGVVLAARYQHETNEISVSWDIDDPDSGLVGFVWGVSQGKRVVVAPEWVGRQTSASSSSVSLRHGASYTVTVTACNTALLCESFSHAIIVDTTAPSGGAVFAGGLDTHTSASGTPCSEVLSPRPSAAQILECVDAPLLALPHVTALYSVPDLHWGGFFDMESPVSFYVVSLGTSEGGSQLGEPVVLDASKTSVTVKSLVTRPEGIINEVVFHNTPVYASVTAINAAGLLSTISRPLFAIDKEPPTPGIIAFNAHLAQAAVVVPGLQSNATGEGAVVQSSTSAVSVWWEPFKSSQGGLLATNDTDADATPATTPVDAYTVHVEDADGTVVARPQTVAAAASLLGASWDDLTLSPSTPYRAVVAATDTAGNTIVARSSHHLIVDVTPPVQDFAIRDGVLHDMELDCQSRLGEEAMDPSDILTVDARVEATVVAADAVLDIPGTLGTSLSVTEPQRVVDTATVVRVLVPPFQDLESGIQRVAIAAGTSPHATDAMDWITVFERSPSAVSHVQPGAYQLLLPPQHEGVVVYTSVKAWNAAGLSTVTVSDGVRVVCRAGTPDCDFDSLFVCLSM